MSEPTTPTGRGKPLPITKTGMFLVYDDYATPDKVLAMVLRIEAEAREQGARDERERLRARLTRPDDVVSVHDANGNKWWERLTDFLADPIGDPS
jgi:hypothetical protein